MIDGRSVRRQMAIFAVDLAITLGALALATFARMELGTLPTRLSSFLDTFGIPHEPAWTVAPFWYITPLRVYVIVALLWPAFLVSCSVYDLETHTRSRSQLWAVFRAVTVATMVLAGVLYFMSRGTPRLVLVSFYVLDMTMLIGIRLFANLAWRAGQAPKDMARARVLVVGAGDVGRRVVQKLTELSSARIRVVAYVDDDNELQGELVAGVRVEGTLEQLEEVVDRFAVGHAIVALPLYAYERFAVAARRLQDRSVLVHVVPDVFALSFPGSQLRGFLGLPMISLRRVHLTVGQLATKRTFDCVVSALSLVLASPLMIAFVIAIRLTSSGPILFRQERVGQHGESFTMFKFRTMDEEADPEVHVKHVTDLIRSNVSPEDAGTVSVKLHSDSRVTPIGSFLRRYSLDELPQLFNVLRGEMSIVGPRPPLPYEVEQYKEWHKQRLEVLPGVTGLWQVYARNRVSFDEMVRLDIQYIESYTLLRDFWILLRTPWAMLSGLGAG